MNNKSECSVCKKLIHKGSLKRHMQEKHSSDRRKFQCEHCKKSFARRAYLTKHIQICVVKKLMDSGRNDFISEEVEIQSQEEAFEENKSTHSEEEKQSVQSQDSTDETVMNIPMMDSQLYEMISLLNQEIASLESQLGAKNEVISLLTKELAKVKDQNSFLKQQNTLLKRDLEWERPVFDTKIEFPNEELQKEKDLQWDNPSEDVRASAFPFFTLDLNKDLNLDL